MSKAIGMYKSRMSRKMKTKKKANPKSTLSRKSLKKFPDEGKEEEKAKETEEEVQIVIPLQQSKSKVSLFK